MSFLLAEQNTHMALKYAQLRLHPRERPRGDGRRGQGARARTRTSRSSISASPRAGASRSATASTTAPQALAGVMAPPPLVAPKGVYSSKCDALEHVRRRWSEALMAVSSTRSAQHHHAGYWSSRHQRCGRSMSMRGASVSTRQNMEERRDRLILDDLAEPVETHCAGRRGLRPRPGAPARRVRADRPGAHSTVISGRRRLPAGMRTARSSVVGRQEPRRSCRWSDAMMLTATRSCACDAPVIILSGKIGTPSTSSYKRCLTFLPRKELRLGSSASA